MCLNTAPGYNWRKLDIASMMRPRHTSTNSFTHTHNQYAVCVCVCFHHTFLFHLCFVLCCNWKGSEGILGNMTVQLEEGTQADDIKMYKFHLFFAMAVQSGVGLWGVGVCGGDSHLLTWPLQCLTTSVPNSHIVSMLKFNADESRLTSWEINVKHQPECFCSSGWRNLIFFFGEVDGDSYVTVCEKVMVRIVVCAGVMVMRTPRNISAIHTFFQSSCIPTLLV